MSRIHSESIENLYVDNSVCESPRESVCGISLQIPMLGPKLVRTTPLHSHVAHVWGTRERAPDMCAQCMINRSRSCLFRAARPGAGDSAGSRCVRSLTMVAVVKNTVFAGPGAYMIMIISFVATECSQTRRKPRVASRASPQSSKYLRSPLAFVVRPVCVRSSACVRFGARTLAHIAPTLCRAAGGSSRITRTLSRCDACMRVHTRTRWWCWCPCVRCTSQFSPRPTRRAAGEGAGRHCVRVHHSVTHVTRTRESARVRCTSSIH